jgi:cytochrome bd-type quinol oxidase subunit 1
MWTRYRQLKHSLVFPLVVLALLLMKGEPEESARWYAGLFIALLLGIAYLAEEIGWMIQNRGRPCAKCGQRIQVRAFSLRVRCSHCGHSE